MSKALTPTSEDRQAVWLISANDLLQGDVVYLDEVHQWTRQLAEAKRFSQKASANDHVNEINHSQNAVLGALLVPAEQDDSGNLQLLHFRDRFRDHGPTHRGGLTRQSWHEERLSS